MGYGRLVSPPQMHCHNLHANGTAAHAFHFAGSAHVSSGPVRLGEVEASVLSAAIAAAALWNSFLDISRLPRKQYNVSTASLPGSIVGQIWLPCPEICNVTVDPSYNAVENVLVHEFGHGIGLPIGSVSSEYPAVSVDASHHWAPPIDAREIMTAVLDPNPYLSKYTLDAMAPHNHRGCRYNYHCTGSASCHAHSPDHPGYCTYEDDLYIESQFLLLLIVIFTFTFILCAAFTCKEQSQYDHTLGTL